MNRLASFGRAKTQSLGCGASLGSSALEDGHVRRLELRSMKRLPGRHTAQEAIGRRLISSRVCIYLFFCTYIALSMHHRPKRYGEMTVWSKQKLTVGGSWRCCWADPLTPKLNARLRRLTPNQSIFAWRLGDFQVFRLPTREASKIRLVCKELRGWPVQRPTNRVLRTGAVDPVR